MSYLRFFKVLALPVTAVADAIYYVKNGSVVEQYVTDDNGDPIPVRFPGESGETENVVFTTPSALWYVSHGKGRKPVVMVLDEAGTVVSAGIEHTTDNEFYIRFSSPQKGSVSYY